MFHAARIRLTSWYLLIVMVITVTFSMTLYNALVSELNRFESAQRYRIQRGLQIDQFQFFDSTTPRSRTTVILPTPELIEETRDRIALMLLLINMGVFVFAGGLSYILAGKTLKPIQVMVEDQRRFVTDASHEIRTPLTALKSMIEVNLRDPKLTLAQAKELMRESVEEVNTLTQLSNNLLSLADYQQHNTKKELQLVSTSVIAKEALARVQSIAKGKKIAIEQSVQEQMIQVAPGAFTDLLTVFLDNAIKYSDAHTTIKLTVSKQGKDMLFAIRDHGMGMSQEDQQHIFDRFYRSQAARSREGVTGFGLGLSIAKDIADQHGASIEVESDLGAGTTMTLRLPITQSYLS